MTAVRRRCGAVTAVAALFLPAMLFAQPDPSSVQPLRTAPAAKFTVDAGFRDWGPATVAGTTILAGSPSGRGGLFAVDAVTGKLKWAYRPASVNGSVSTLPAVTGDVVMAPFGAANPGAVVGVSLATGKEIWRGPDPAVGAAVAVHAGLAFVLGKDGNFYALEAATGHEVWKVAFSTRRAACASQPIVRDDAIYLTGSAEATPGDAGKPAGYYLFALDARTGKERWRYRAEAPYVQSGACLRQPVVTATTIFAAGESHIYAVDRTTGRDRWKPVETRRPVEGRDRQVDVYGLVDAGSVLVGLTEGFLVAFDKSSGQARWEIPGEYYTTQPSTAVAGNVLYFQGSPGIKPAPSARGTLNALDLDTRAILWSFSRPTAEANWPFGFVTPVDGGLWVDSYKALVKLQQ